MSFFQKALFYKKNDVTLQKKKLVGYRVSAWRALHGIGRNTMVKLECVEKDIFSVSVIDGSKERIRILPTGIEVMTFGSLGPGPSCSKADQRLTRVSFYCVPKHFLA